MKKNARWVGFLPKPALLHSLEEGRVFGAKSQEWELAGYLLFLQNARRFRITHLCVATKFRRQGIARRLVEYLKTTATSQKVIQLNCRRDFPAHEMWPSLGFVPTGEKWARVADRSLVSRQEFESHCKGKSIASALEIVDVWEFESPSCLTDLRNEFPNFVVPQSWRFVRPEEQRLFAQRRRRKLKVL